MLPAHCAWNGCLLFKYLDNVYYSLANHNTPAQTNQSEPTAYFWGSGFIESGSQPVVQMTEENAADNKGEIYEK